jgi:hypothetical protein
MESEADLEVAGMSSRGFLYSVDYKVRQKQGEEFESIIFVLLSPVLLATIYAGANVFWSMVLFDYNDDIVIARILSYVVPVIFVLSNCLILIIRCGSHAS